MEAEPSAPDAFEMPHEGAEPVTGAPLNTNDAEHQAQQAPGPAVAPAAQAAISANAFAAALAQAMGLVNQPGQPGIACSSACKG